MLTPPTHRPTALQVWEIKTIPLLEVLLSSQMPWTALELLEKAGIFVGIWLLFLAVGAEQGQNLR